MKCPECEFGYLKLDTVISPCEWLYRCDDCGILLTMCATPTWIPIQYRETEGSLDDQPKLWSDHLFNLETIARRGSLGILCYGGNRWWGRA